jgi:GntR family transcriptional regulator
MTAPLDAPWEGARPIYRQLRDRLIALILDGDFPEGEPLPSVRVLAQRLHLNALTIWRAYQELLAERLVDARRGRGLYVAAGVTETLRAAERARFLAHEWPGVCATLARLRLSSDELPAPLPPPQR